MSWHNVPVDVSEGVTNAGRMCLNTGYSSAAPHLTPTLMILHGAQRYTKILTAIQIREIIQIEIRLRTEAGVKQREHGLRADDGLCRPRHCGVLFLI